MKLSFSFFLTLVASSSAQYFSAGWNPGQKQPEASITSVSKPSPTAQSVKATATTTRPSLFNLFDTNKILTSGPSVALFNRFGINITERVEISLLEKIWDGRVSLITDGNYEDLVVNEVLTDQEEKDRVWLIVISVTSAKTDGVSKYLDNIFDTAFNQTLIAGDLPHVKWGRIDYFNVTRVTTKWGVWQAPRLVVLKDRGKTLRFYRPQQLRLKEDALREFLKVDGWAMTPPWSSSFAPGGSNEYLMDYFAFCLTKFYNFTMLLPRWLLVFLSGTLASAVIGFLHKPSQAAPTGATPSKSNTTVSTTAAAPKPNASSESAAPQAKRTGAKQRKTKS